MYNFKRQYNLHQNWFYIYTHTLITYMILHWLLLWHSLYSIPHSCAIHIVFHCILFLRHLYCFVIFFFKINKYHMYWTDPSTSILSTKTYKAVQMLRNIEQKQYKWNWNDFFIIYHLFTSIFVLTLLFINFITFTFIHYYLSYLLLTSWSN